VTVSVPCFNEVAHIGEVLAHLVAQKLSRGRVRIVVADGGSTDGTVDVVARLARHHPQIRLVHNPGRFAGPARNLAACSGPFDVFVVVDAHCHVPDDGYLQRVLDALAESRAYCLSRPQPIRTDAGDTGRRASAVARASWLGHCPGSLIYDTATRDYVSAISAAQVYRREVFEEVGLFVEHLSSCEDLEFNIRVEQAGLSCFHCPRTILEYHPRQHLKALFHHMFRYGQGRTRVAAMHRDHAASLTGILPALFVLWIVAAPLLHWIGHGLGTLHTASLLFYAAILAAESLRQAPAHGPRVALALPFEYLAIHLGWGVGQLSAMVQGTGWRHRTFAPAPAFEAEAPDSMPAMQAVSE
jgi:GT2 family glycosyltransferase